MSGVDLYRGFEGEPEVTVSLVEGGQRVRWVRLWEGDVARILAGPTRSGWRGLALPYHLHTGWYEASPWRVPDVTEARDAWAACDGEGWDARTRAAHAAVLALLTAACEAEERGGEVWVADG